MKETNNLSNTVATNFPAHYDGIEIINFRLFSNLSVRQLGQYNLILGNNNVGKTSFLEGMLFSANLEECLNSWQHINMYRGGGFNNNFFNSLLRRSAKKREIQFIIKKGGEEWRFSIKKPTYEELLKKLGTDNFDPDNYLALDNDLNETQIQPIPKKNGKLVNFVPFGKSYSDELATIYYAEIGRNRKLRNKFIEQMKIFIPKIEGINVNPEGNVIEIEEQDFDEPFLLYNYGEGANKLFRILVQLHAAKDNRLMIDEIDAGIHHTRFKLFWQIILKVAKEYNVQLFATTHNDECIRYFKEVLEDVEFESYKKEARSITLERHAKTNEIVALVRDFEQLAYVYDFQTNLRGREL